MLVQVPSEAVEFLNTSKKNANGNRLYGRKFGSIFKYLEKPHLFI
jgi:hypothetical protein